MLAATWIFRNLAGFLLLLNVLAASATCPAMCFCPSLSRIVYCPRKGQQYIPSGIPHDTVQLNMNDNPFMNPVISRANFTNYRDLEQLYLTGCGIEFIEVDTFIDNKRLKWLDIGKNKLKTISDFTFRDLTLDHLFLNDNPGVQISTQVFGGLKTTGLYMQNNYLDKLSLEVFRPMNGTLQTLWIDGNKFERFNSQWLFLFKTLSHLRLGNNPLHCNCEARWLYDFFNSTSRTFEGGSPPACLSPRPLRGKTFLELSDNDFKCQLPVFKNVDVIFEKTVGKMTCLASGDPVPTIYWMKPDGMAEVFIPKSGDITKEMEGVMYLTNPKAQNKNRYQCVASNPAGNVTFSINVAWPTEPEYDSVSDISDTKINDAPTSEKDEKTKKVDDISIKSLSQDDSVINTVQSNSSKVFSNEVAAVPRDETEGRFSAGDIVGAVVGTFLLTLLLCAIVFHVYYRYQRKCPSPVHHQNGVTHHSEIKRGPPSRHELDEVEHTMKMLEKGTYDIHV